MTTHRLSILHFSDLHERIKLDWMPAKRKAEIRLGAAQRYRVLGPPLEEILRDDVLKKGPVDLVCFTGDIADWGLAEEYLLTERRMTRLLKSIGVGPNRLFAVPGNHDVQRKVEEEAWTKFRELAGKPILHDGISRWMGGQSPPPGGEDPWRDSLPKRTEAFWAWLARQRGSDDLHPSKSPHGRLGYRFTFPRESLRFPFDIHLLGLDSAWLAGDDSDTGRLLLTWSQLDLLGTTDNGEPLPGFRLALVHHPLACLADQKVCHQRLAGTVDLLLHGHQHDPIAKEDTDPDRSLHVLAAGSLFEGEEGDRYINSFNRIDIDLDSQGHPLCFEVTFYGWSPTGHWHRTGAVYQQARDGVLRWTTPEGKRASSSHQASRAAL